MNDAPEPPWPIGGDNNCRRVGWRARFDDDPRTSPFPPDRRDLSEGFYEGWDLAHAKIVMALAAWRPTHAGGWPEGYHEYFMVRPPGTDPRTRRTWVPSVVRIVDGELYTATDEIHALRWDCRGRHMGDGGDSETMSTTLCAEADLEWRPLPE